MMNAAELTRRIREKAFSLGFDAVGISPAEEVPQERLLEWLQRGFQGEMAYLERNAPKRLHPELVLEGARSIVSLALNYHDPRPLPYDRPDRAVISRYAAGEDYHGILEERLEQLSRFLQDLKPSIKLKPYVDTGPVMDKYWAARSGLGWLGKHTNVLARDLGSWFFLGELLLDCELEYDSPATDFCGSCTRCVDACPTGAIVEPYLLDSRRCISYLTIELKNDIPEEFRSLMKNLVYGCDICQEVCPWNRSAPPSQVEAFQARPENREPQLRELARLGPEEFAGRFRKNPIKRAKWRGLMRNVAVALGNSEDPAAVEELTGLLHSGDPLIQRHAAWALQQIGTLPARRALQNAGLSDPPEDQQQDG